MHYKNGRAVKVGDKVFMPERVGTDGPATGIIINASPGSQTCNLQVVPLPCNNVVWETAGNCLRMDDVLETLKNVTALVTPAEKPAS